MKLNLLDNLPFDEGEFMETNTIASAVNSDIETSKEDVGYGEVQVQNGYSRGTSMAVEISGSGSANLKVDLEVNLMTKESIERLLNFAMKECHDEEATSKLKNVNVGNVSGGFLSFIQAADKNKNDYRNGTKKVDMNDKEFQNKFAHEIADSHEDKYRVKGDLTLTSKSFIKSKATIFFEITKFTVMKKDGKKVERQIASENAVAADEEGNVNPDVKVQGKLNIVDI